MKRTLMVFGWILLVAPPLASQNPQRVANGVQVWAVPARSNEPAHNVGLVAFDDGLLIIDAGPGDTWPDVFEALGQSVSEPARFIVHTYGNPGTADSAATQGMTRLVRAAYPAASGSGNLIAFPTSMVLAGGGRSVELHPVDADPTGGPVTVFVVNSGVLFAGDLVGLGRGPAPVPLEAWIQALERLERLQPRVVVPGRGPVSDAELLTTTRQALVRLRTRIAAAVGDGKTRDQTLESVTADDLAVLPAGTTSRVFDEIVGLQPATAFVAGMGLQEGTSAAAAAPGWTLPSKVVVADLWPGRTGQLGRVAPGVELVVVADPQQAAAVATDADAVLGWLTPEILSSARRLRWVQLPAAGVERYLAIPGFVESDVVLTNAQRIFAPGGAEHVLAMVLALSRRLHTALSLQRERRWDTLPLTGPAPYSGDGSELLELRGRTMLVVGLGGIGTEVARLAHGIGMRVIATRGSSREGPPFVEYVGLSTELLTLAPQADVIVSSVPYTAATEDMFDGGFFAKTKPTAFFVNIGRGRTVDTDALTQALRAGRIAGAGLDVTDPEPLPPDHELWGMPNVIITPHVGGDSDGHMERLWQLFRENLRRFASGEPLLSVVDKRRGY